MLVGIDGTTFSDLNTRWPFPRRWHARVIDRLHRAGARVIAYDLEFTGQTDTRDDNALIEAAGRAGNLVFAATAVDAQGTPPCSAATRPCGDITPLPAARSRRRMRAP